MTQPVDLTHQASYEASELSADQQEALTLQCNDAYARARLRKLRALILFAQSEPETIPGYDEDTGTFGPRANFEATHPARSLAMHAMESSACAPLLKELGWTDETAGADWDTMLRHLPADRLQPLPWPGGRPDR